MRNRVIFILMTMVVLAVVSTKAATPITLPQGAKAGVYVAYEELKSSGNYVDNACLTFDGSNWSADNKLMWKDGDSYAYFYAYYPYAEDVKDATVLPFSVKTDQSTAEAYQASDFLYGKYGGNPHDGLPKSVLQHGMANIVVNVKAGNGFTENELKQGNLSVHVKNVYLKANVNLENGGVTASGSVGGIKAYATSALSFSAIVVPQEVRKLSVVWNNVEYNLGFSQYCEKGKLYTLTATLKKTSGGISVTIGGWEDSGEDFGGTVN
jgi:hypothetical protein